MHIERPNEIFGRNITSAIIRLLSVAYQRLMEGDNNFGDMVMFGRVPSVARLGAVYAVPTNGNELRGIGVVIALSKRNARGGRLVGCVRFLVDPSKLEGRPVNAADICMQSSCSSSRIERDCQHIVYCKGALSMVQSILAIQVRAYRSVVPECWRCLLVGPREGVTSVVWVTFKCGIATRDDISFVPVVEARGRKQLYMNLERRLRCMHCRRASANRGLCEPEQPVLAEVEKIEKTRRTQTNPEKSLKARFYGNEDDAEDDFDVAGSSSNDSRIDYVAKLIRRMIACESDYVASAGFLFGVAGAYASIGTAIENDKDVADEFGKGKYVMYDNERLCEGCGKILCCAESGRNCGVKRREVVVHTLIHGTVPTVVLYLVCEKCQIVTVFDGWDAAMFSWSSTAIYSRFLVDFF